jgi:hypothetical protein
MFYIILYVNKINYKLQINMIQNLLIQYMFKKWGYIVFEFFNYKT